MTEPVSVGQASAPGTTPVALTPRDSSTVAGELSAKLKWHALDFPMQTQDQTNWCWAAVAVSVARFYSPASTATQCAVADGELSRTDCCGAGADGPCDVYGMLGSSLYRVGHLERWAVAKKATFAELRAEIDARRPLCARVAWSDGGAHFVAIVGYLAGGGPLAGSDMVAVDDPKWGQSDVSYNTFCTSYLGTGHWTDSYYTKA